MKSLIKWRKRENLMVKPSSKKRDMYNKEDEREEDLKRGNDSPRRKKREVKGLPFLQHFAPPRYHANEYT